MPNLNPCEPHKSSPVTPPPSLLPASPFREISFPDRDKILSESKLQLGVTSETGALRKVLVGNPDHYPNSASEVDEINLQSSRTRKSGVLIGRDEVKAELRSLISALRSLGVEVLQPSPVQGARDQIYARDIGFVIHDRFVIANMDKEGRQREQEGIAELISNLHLEPLRVPRNMTIEGGDVFVEQGRVYVGQSARTSNGAAEFLQGVFPHLNVIPVPLVPPNESHEALHLDCAYAPISRDLAIIHRASFQVAPEEIFGRKRTFIEVTDFEQSQLATNILSVAPGVVITRTTASRINAILREHGFTTIPLKFDGPPQMGGSFRCCTLPLLREGC